MPWDDEQKEAFLRTQFDAQDATTASTTRARLRRHPGRRRAGRPALRRPREARDPDRRHRAAARAPRRGIGTRCSASCSTEADAAGKRVTIHVERLNPALRLYERLGFSVAEDKGVYLLLERLPRYVNTAS